MPAPEATRPRLYLLDGYALIYRAFFAMISRPLISSRGENTSAAYGMTRFLLKVFDQYKPEYVGVVFDAGMSMRHELLPSYKATREKMPTELESSIPRVQQVIEGFRVPVLRLQGYEADDVIGTLAKQAAEQGLEAVIVSGDKDFYQLIGPNVCLLNPGRGGPQAIEEEWVSTDNAHERLGVAPEHVTDYLGLIGDTSDNVPGVQGIGPKTAIQLIEQFGSIENILERRQEIKAKRAREALEAHADTAMLSKRLVTIDTNVDIALDLDALRRKEPDRERLKEVFLELEFNTFVREFGAPAPEEKAVVAVDYQLVQTPEEVAALCERIRQVGRFSFDTETNSTDPMRADLVGMSIGVSPREAYYLPMGHDFGPEPKAQPDLLGEEGGKPTEIAEEVREAEAGSQGNLPDLHDPSMKGLLEILEEPWFEKIAQNLKYDLLVMRRAGVKLHGGGFDTMIASYLLDPGRREHGLDALALQHLDHKTITYEEVAGKGKNQIPFARVSLDAAREYACEDADITLRLAEHFEPSLRELKLDGLFRTVEMPLVKVLADMEWAGIRIDEQMFAESGKQLGAQKRDLEEEIYKEAGTRFNIGSNKQLQEILFERLGLSVLKKTKTGASTDVEVLQALAAQGHRLPELLMQFRQLDKLLSTYIDALPRMVNPETGRIHTSFNQTIAATGRLSSTDPNLQNIPIRTEMGAEIRRGFIPAEGHVFLSVDYSQIELRILAHYSEDPAFVEAFRSGEDIHRQTASLVFGVPLAEVSKEMRGRAKTVNFAVIYGIGAYSLANRLGITGAEARDFIDRYFERFPGVRRYLDDQMELARKQGYVETLTGRRRYIPEIASKNFNVRSFGERAATNAPIQGSSADLIKIAMIRIHQALQDEGMQARMLLQVHDELLLEVPHGEEQATLGLVKDRMEGAAELRVPLLVESGIGSNWLTVK